MQRVLGLGSYKTAWTWLHKLRRALGRPGRDRLSGTIEVDETYIGGPEEGARGRQTETKALVVIAAEEDGAGIGRIRMRRIADASAESLLPFVEEAVELDATSSSCGVAAETLAPRHSPRSGESRTSRLLPGRIHIQVQPADVPKSWQTLLPPCPAICRGGTGP